jgi:hypothetical protein
LKFFLANYPEVAIVMDVVVIDVPDAWGMLLSRKWVATLGGNLQMDLSFSTIPIGNGHYATLYNQPRAKKHVEDPNNEDAWSDHEFDIPLKLHEENHGEENHQEPMNPPIDPYLSQDLDFSLLLKKMTLVM